MHPALIQTDNFLRGVGPFAPTHMAARPAWWLPAMILVFGPLYGGVMGSYGFDSPERLLMVLYSAAKVPLLLAVTSLLCLPGFFVLNTILGLRDDFHEAIQAVLAGQAGLSIALTSLAPLTRFWYFSTDSYRSALLFNAAIFTAATLAGQIVMFRYYRVLIQRRARHAITLAAWLAFYAFVGIQMGWLLRPFIGSPGMRVTFLRDEPFSNAYVVVARLIFGT